MCSQARTCETNYIDRREKQSQDKNGSPEFENETQIMAEIANETEGCLIGNKTDSDSVSVLFVLV